MNIEEIKVGETYNVRVKVTQKTSESITAETVDKNGRFLCENEFAEEETAAFSPIAVSIGYMKYDPFRRFKEGDIVEPREVNGRTYCPAVEDLTGERCVVVVSEIKHCNIRIRHGEDDYTIDPAYLELITPVEELGSFGVRYNTDRDWAEVYHRRYKNTVAAFYCKCGITREQAEKAAEAERDRLNAEWRKEQNNE